jgi:OCT family organic cation transporter-like MFS transporter 4/5
MLNVGNVGNNIFIDSITTYIGEATAEMISGYLANLYGRLFVLKLCGYLGGVSFLIFEFIDDPRLRSVLIFLTSFGLSGLFNIMYIYSPEVFPTSIRSTVIGFLYLTSRTGALLVPTFSAVVKKTALVFGIMSLLSCFLTGYLKESMGCAIEDEVPEFKDVCGEEKDTFLVHEMQDLNGDKKNKLLDDKTGGSRNSKLDF